MNDKGNLPKMPDEPPFGTYWRHRNGGEYRVLGNARVEATLEPVVIYCPKSGGDMWTRPVSEFLDGRFTMIEMEE